MKTKILLFSLLTLFVANSIYAQDRTTVNATSSEISDNLDLRAVASLFGDAENLEDFERRLNDPKVQISNLDLNNDNQVDYLRVIESVEGRTHLIVVQSVLGRDQYQDVATIEVEKDQNNKVQIQVVGDVYMYGSNYIYEPIYVHVPVIYNYFWASNYRPYCSTWYWNYYPTYYYAWNPFPVFRYRHHIGLCINFNYQYNYVHYRRCQVAYEHYYGRRGNHYENQYPNRSFNHRNSGYTNRYDLDQTRPRRDVAYNDSPRNTTSNPRGIGSNSPRSEANQSPRNYDSPRSTSYSTPRSSEPRSEANQSPRSYDSPRSTSYSTPRSSEPRSEANQSPRSYDSPRSTNYSSPRSSEPRSEANQSPRSYDSPRSTNYSTPRSSEPRGMNSSSGASRGESGGRSSGRR